MNIKKVKIDDGEFGLINADIRYNNDGKKKPVVVFLHGFKSYKDWGFIPQVCKEFATSGAIAFNFDFSQNGIVDSRKPKFDPEIFRKQTITKMMEDATIVVNYIRTNMAEITEDQFNGNIHLVGHSLGGAVSILAASKYRLKVDRIILWNSIAKLDRNTERQKEQWVKNKSIEIKIEGCDQALPLDVSYLTDKEILGNDAILEAISKIKQNILIVQAKEDLTTKLKEAKLLKEHAKEKAKLFVIENSGHTFGIKNKFEHVTPSLAEAIERSIAFMEI